MELLYDTAKMEQCGKDMLRLIESLENKYDSLFDRLHNIPKVTGEWIGPAAENFATKVLLEKKEYDNYIIDLKYYANFLIDYAYELESKKGKMRK